MTSPIVALKDSIQQWLLQDTTLLALLREPKIFPNQPKHAAHPHIAFVYSVSRENGTSSDQGHIVELIIGIWSRHQGSEESLDIAARIEQRLETIPQSLAGHRLVNLIVRSVEPTRLKDAETWRTDLRIRTVTEVI